MTDNRGQQRISYAFSSASAPVAIFNAIYLTKLELSLLTYIISGGGGESKLKVQRK